MVSISILLVSFVGILSLFSLSVWELRARKKIFASYRRALDRYSFVLVTSIQKRIPKMEQRLFVRLYHDTVHEIAVVLLKVITLMERKMSGVVDRVRGKRELAQKETQSDFLKSVSKHKQSLVKDEQNLVE